MVPLFQFGGQCQECRSDLKTAKADIADLQKINADKDQQIKSLTTERDTTVNAVHGGTTMQHVWHDGKVAIVVGAAAYLAGRAKR